MNELQSFFLAFGEGLLLGVLPFFLLLKGFLPAFFRVRFAPGKYLLRLHMDDGHSVKWIVGVPYENGVIYKLGKEEYFISIVAGVAKRQFGVNVVDVPHGLNESAPFNYQKVTVSYDEQDRPVVDEDNKPVFGDDKKPLFERVTVPSLTHFLGWDDSRQVMVMLRTALMQPRSGMGLGNIDFKKLLWILVVLGGAAYLAFTVLKGDPTVI